MLKAFKYRIYPTADQRQKIAQQFGCCRYIYNWGLQRKMEAYQSEGKSISCFDLINEMTSLKKEILWLKDCYSQALQMSLRNLDNAYTRFFREKKGFPKFKSKHSNTKSCQYPQGVQFKDGAVYLPKIGNVKLIQHRPYSGTVKTVTLSQTPTGKYYISVLAEDGCVLPEKQKFDADTTIGVDVGIKHFATLSTGEKIEHPKCLKKAEKKLKRAQQIVSRRKKGSQNRKRAIYILAAQHEKVTNRRNDFLHKLSHRLVSENQAVAVETLNVSGMMKNHRLAKSIGDSGWGRFFVFLDYKADWQGKNILEIGAFAPSSKTCNACGTITHELRLKDRIWTCQKCGKVHDRDKNAADNIKSFALIAQNLIVPRDNREFTLGEIAGCSGR